MLCFGRGVFEMFGLGANARGTRLNTTTCANHALEVHVLAFLGGNVGVTAREHVQCSTATNTACAHNPHTLA
jgi:hypothetical protein